VEVYCICRTSDVSRFMIGCDHCEEWFHGDCVKVTEREAKYIKRYYCRMCRQKNSKLEIVYKSKHKESEDKEPKKKEHKHKKHKKERRRSKDRKDKSPRKSRQLGSSSGGEEDKGPTKTDQEKKPADEPRSVLKPKSHRPSVDDSSKPASSPKQTPVAAPKLPAVSKDQLLSHQQSIKKPDPPPAKKRKRSQSDDETSDEDFNADLLAGDGDKTSDGGVGVGGGGSGDSASDDQAEVVPVPAWRAKPAASKTKKDQSKKRPLAPSNRSGGRVQSSSNVTGAGGGGCSKKRRHGRTNAGSSSSDEGDTAGVPAAHVDDSKPRQCHGQKCINSCRLGSNYCSDNCGIKLASMRIMQTLPDRIREWNLTPCQAEKQNRKELEKIHAKQDAVKAKLEQLNRDFRELEDLISRGKAQEIDQEKEDEEEEGESAETYVHCVTCGADIQTRTAIRHMERCYNKFESKTSFASKFKTQIDDERMFCDYFNPKDATFCKRLQVLCPEHNKDQLAEDEVCGYPIQTQVFAKPTEFCRLSQRKCQRHSFWEKLRRAEIDMERVRNWMKVDELMEQERVVKSTMSSRAGVLGLLLHSSIDHQIEAKFAAQRAAAVAREAAQMAAQMRQKFQAQKSSKP